MEGRIFYLIGIVYFLVSLAMPELVGFAAGGCGVVLLCVAAAGVVLLSRGKKLLKVALVTAAVAASAFSARYFLDFLPQRGLAGQKVHMQGWVQSLGAGRKSFYCLVKAKINLPGGKTQKAKLLLYG